MTTKMELESISMDDFLNEKFPGHKILCMGSPGAIQKLEDKLAMANLGNISY
jgi:hypothetical protein